MGSMDSALGKQQTGVFESHSAKSLIRALSRQRGQLDLCFCLPLCTPPIWSLGHQIQLNVCCLGEPTGQRGGHCSSQHGPAVALPLGSKRVRNQESRAALSPSPCSELCLCYPHRTWLSVGSPKGRPEPGHGGKGSCFWSPSQESNRSPVGMGR